MPARLSKLVSTVSQPLHRQGAVGRLGHCESKVVKTPFAKEKIRDHRVTGFFLCAFLVFVARQHDRRWQQTERKQNCTDFHQSVCLY